MPRYAVPIRPGDIVHRRCPRGGRRRCSEPRPTLDANHRRLTEGRRSRPGRCVVGRGRRQVGGFTGNGWACFGPHQMPVGGEVDRARTIPGRERVRPGVDGRGVCPEPATSRGLESVRFGGARQGRRRVRPLLGGRAGCAPDVARASRRRAVHGVGPPRLSHGVEAPSRHPGLPRSGSGPRTRRLVWGSVRRPVRASARARTDRWNATVSRAESLSPGKRRRDVVRGHVVWDGCFTGNGAGRDAPPIPGVAVHLVVGTRR